MITAIEDFDYGKIMAMQGPTKYTDLIMSSLAMKLSNFAPVIYLDTNTSFNPAGYDAVDLERLHLARFYTAEELLKFIKHLPTSLDKTKSRILVISSIDHLLLDAALEPAETEQLIQEITQELQYLKEARGILTLLAFDYPRGPKSWAIQHALAPKLTFLSKL